MNFIKNHLTKFQFIAAFIAIALGAQQVYERFIVANTPVLEWNVRSGNFSVSSGRSTAEFRVVVTRTLLRNNCSLRSFEPYIIDANGFNHTVTASAPRASAGGVGKEQTFRYVFKLINPNSVGVGEAMLRGTLTYDCREGQQVIEYPDTPLLEFQISG